MLIDGVCTDPVYNESMFNEEERSVLNELLAAGYPLQVIGNHFNRVTPLVDPIDIRLVNPTYEDDFWAKPGHAGSNPPNYLKAALIDGWATSPTSRETRRAT